MITVHGVSMLESWLLGHKVELTIDTWRFLEGRLLELLLVWHGEMLTIIVHVWIFKVSVEAVLSLHVSIWAVRLSGLHLWLFKSYWRLEFLSIRWELSLNEAHFDLIEDFINTSKMICFHAFQVFYNPFDNPENPFGDSESVFNFISCWKAPEGNYENSYFTFWSSGKIIIINLKEKSFI